MNELFAVNFLIEIALIIISATICSYIFKLLKQPTILAFIIAGILIAPLSFGFLGITFNGLPLVNINEIRVLAELGIAFMLFSVGIETDITKLKSVLKFAIIAALIQVFLTFLIVLILTLQLTSLTEAMYFGLILAFSSTLLVVKILSDSYQIDSLHGRLMVGILIIQDLLVIILMPLIQNIQQIISYDFYSNFLFSGIILALIGYILMKFVYPKIFSFSLKSNELLFLTTLSICFFFIFLSLVFLKIPLALGAFIAGLSLSKLPYNLELYNQIKALRDFFIIIFFVSLGMQLTFNFNFNVIILLVIALIATFILKPLIIFFLTYFAGYGSKNALTVALALSQTSEFSFIIASQGLILGLISQELFSIAIMVVAISMILTPYFFNFNENIYLFFQRFGIFSNKTKSNIFYKKIKEFDQTQYLENHIIIIGAGTTGATLASELKELNFKTLIVERNIEIVKQLKDKGFNILYGNAANPSVWRKLNLEKAKLLILAIPDIKAALSILKYAKTVNKKIIVFGRAHYYKDVLDLYENNADFVATPHIMSANILFKATIELMKNNKKDFIRLKTEFFDFLKKHAEEQEAVRPLKLKGTDLI